MPELDEQIRSLIDDGDPVGLAELTERRRQHRLESRVRLTIRFGTVAAVLVVLAILATVLSAPGDQAPRSRQLRWHLAGFTGPTSLSVQGGAGSGTYELQCPTTTTCYAAEPVVVAQTAAPNGTVEVSTDAGRTWRSVLNAAGADLFGLTCPSEYTCAVTGEDFEQGSTTDTMYLTINGGRTWTTHLIPGGSQSSSLLSCQSQAECIATTTGTAPSGHGEQATALVTNNGGRTWTSAAFPDSFVPFDVECHEILCVATGAKNPGGGPAIGQGAEAYSSDDGSTWHVSSQPTADMVSGLWCADAEHCMAHEQTLLEPGTQRIVPSPLGDTIISTSDGGATWTPIQGNEPQNWLISGIDCPNVLDCWITGESHQAGETMEQIAQNAGPSFVRFTTDGGQTWQSIPLPLVKGHPITVIGSLSCPSISDCFALADNPGPHTGPFPQEVVLSTEPSRLAGGDGTP